jgi:phosphatidate phosphatase APP1
MHDDEPGPTPDDARQRARAARLHRGLLKVEGTLERRTRRLRTRLGLDRPARIVAYRSFGTGDRVVVHGRVLANKGARSARETDRWWHNLGQTYRRWNTVELPGVTVTLALGGEEHRVTTDDEGYYRAELPDPQGVPDHLEWRSVGVHMMTTHRGETVAAEAHHDVLVPGRDAEVLYLSDIDDTVLHTHATSATRMAWLTFLHNARSRQPLPGISALYQAFAHGAGREQATQPLAFVSSSAHNLYDLLVDFLELHEVPPAPLLLRDLGLDENKIVKSKGHGHKLERIEEVMALYPHLPVVLLGDSGQHDPQLYAEAARRHGDRIRAIYIRDVDPDTDDTPRDRLAEQSAEQARALGVPFVISGDSGAFASHARSLGLIDEAQEQAVRDEVDADRARPPLTPDDGDP